MKVTQHRAGLTGQPTDLKATTTMRCPVVEVIHEVKEIGECKKENEGEEGTLTG